MKRSILVVVMLSLVTCACRDLDRFRTATGETYCGDMASAPLFHEGMLPEGIPQRLEMRLELDVDRLSSRPARVTTDDADRGLCAEMGQPLFAEAEARAIDELQHDPLSTMDLGEGRELNVLSWVDSTCQGTMLMVLSLMSNEAIEVRLLKPAPLPPEGDVPPGKRPGFALFHLKQRQLSSCDF